MDNITAPAIGARIATDEIDSVHYPLDKIGFGVDGEFRRVTDADPLPSHDAALLAAVQALLPGTGALPAGAATDAKLELIRALLAGVLNVSATALPLPNGAATQATLAAMLAKMIATPATEGKQDAMLTALAATLSTLPIIKPWATWATTTAIDMRNYAGVEIQVTAAGTAAFTRSAANDANYVPVSATSAGAAATSPLAAGFYSLKGGGWLTFTGTAAITVRGYN